MIKNIIFDMGRVLIQFDQDYFIEKIGITGPEDKELLKRNVFYSLEWSRMDRGSLTDEEACQIMCKKLPERLHNAVELLTCKWDRPIVPIEGMADLVKELKEKGYKIYLLSNASLRQRTYWDKIPGSEYFDGTVISAEEKLVKPQPEIYRLICDRFDLVPSECVFIDDATFNCEGAFYCGINPIVFHGDVNETREILKEMGVL